ncbi:MAG: LptF/LptG family permease [Sulfurovum sp.]|nr:LptF/LptG family permease [Sulfurovum sp.]
MARVRGFILSQFSKNYLLLFLPLFSILSIVYIIRISSLSKKISLSSGEFFTLFGFFLPDILFYTLPLSFIAALTVTLMKLSEDNELIALFSFGLTPAKILNMFIVPSVLFTILMLVLSLHTMPQSTLALKLFESKKTIEAKLEIVPNRLGQKFGEYIVFLGNKRGDNYQNIVLFATDNKDKRVIVMADKAQMKHNDSKFTLILYQGSGDTFLPNTIESITYDKMQLYSYPQNDTNTEWLSRGWSKIWISDYDMAQLIYRIFLSLSPVLVLAGITAFSIINPRFQGNNTYLVSFTTVMSIYLIGSLLRKHGTPTLLMFASGIFILLGIILFNKRTKAHF